MEARQNHLPMWTNRCYAYTSRQEVVRMAAEPGLCSLLPIKPIDFGLRQGGILAAELTEFRRGRGKPETRHLSYCVEPLLHRYARKLYDAAANRLFAELPELGAVAVGAQRQTGAYELQWRVTPDLLEQRQRALMEELLAGGFTMDEELALSCTKRSGARHLSINGALKLQPKSLHALMRRPPEQLLDRPLQAGIAFSPEECFRCYQVFPEERLELGNQFRAYASTEARNADAFAAARAQEFEWLCKLAKNGYNLNAIDRSGASVFGVFACGLLEQYRGKALPRFALRKLDELIFLGANPAIYGVSRRVTAPLATAVDCDQPDAVAYFLQKGVNPDLYPRIEAEGPGVSLLALAQQRADDPLYPNAAEIAQLLADALSAAPAEPAESE